MTTTLLIQKIRKGHKKVDGQLYRMLMHYAPPQPILSKKMHEAYAVVVGDLVRMLVDGSIPPSQEAAIRLYVRSAAHFVEEFETKAYPQEDVEPKELLKFLMEQHNLTQMDLADDFGGQSVVSAVLNGKRELTREQIERLSSRFGVSPAVFFYKAA